MDNNVVYAAFGQMRATQTEKQTAAPLTTLSQNTPTTLAQRFTAQVSVLHDLRDLIVDPNLPKEISEPLLKEFQTLKTTATAIQEKLLRVHTNDQVFLEVQPELTAFGQKLIEFETTVLHKTGASLELVEPTGTGADVAGTGVGTRVNAAHPTNSLRRLEGTAARLWKTPKFWIGLSIGVSVLAGLTWWGLHGRSESEDARARAHKSESTKPKFEKVKLRRALAAR